MFTANMSTEVRVEMCPQQPSSNSRSGEYESTSLCSATTLPSPAPHLSKVLKSLRFPPELQITRFEVASSEKHPTAAKS